MRVVTDLMVVVGHLVDGVIVTTILLALCWGGLVIVDGRAQRRAAREHAELLREIARALGREKRHTCRFCGEPVECEADCPADSHTHEECALKARRQVVLGDPS